MTCEPLLPLHRAVRGAVAAAVFLGALGAGPAMAQDETPPPADEATPAESAPADAAPAEGQPVEGAAEVTETIPVQPTEPAEPVAAADDKDATKLDTLEVTGSRIRRADYETAQPVLVIKREDIERTGLTSIGDVLQKLPIAGTALGTSVNNGGNGSIEVDLRNLTSTRVLVLVNGHRWVNGLNSLSTSSVDLTTIPISIIERIEVLKDGASAIYGSDAIAGVINIILRKDYVGSEWRSQLGAYNRQHGATQSHSLSVGTVVDKTALFLDMNFTRQEAIFNGQRDMTFEPSVGTGTSRGSGGVPAGHFQFQPTPATQSGLNASDPGNCDAMTVNGDPSPIICDVITRTGTSGSNFTHFREFNPVVDPYNYAPVNYLLTPNERTSVFGQLSRELTPNVNFRTELLYNLRRSEQAIAPMPILIGDLAPPPFNELYIDATNVFNPMGQDIGRGSGGVLTTGSGLARNRSLLYGNRLFQQDVDTLRAGFTLSGPVEFASRLLTWDLGYSYAESKDKSITEGLYNLDNLARAVGPATGCTGNCVPFDMFGGPEVNTITADMLAYSGYTSVASTRQLMRDTYANISTELFDFFGQGPVGFAFGAELREEYYQNTPDPLVQAGKSSTNRAKATEGGYDVTEFYAELAVPLVRSLQFAEEIDLTLAGRSSDYSGFGKSETGKVGLRWKMLEDLLLRSTWSTAFRAPNVGELYLGNSDSFPGVLDACSSDNTAVNADARRNCNADGVPATTVDLLGQNLQVFRGNPDLEPEEAETLTAGIVYSPRFIPDLNIYLDWYQIEVDQFISPLDAQYVMDSCYLAKSQDERAFCQYIHRDQTSGIITFIDTPFLNLPRLETEGVDLTIDYLLPWHERGDFRFLLDGAYLTTYNRYDPTASGEKLNEEFQPGRHATLAAAFPRMKINTTLAWAQDNWTASWSMRYIHHMMENCYDFVTEPSLESLGLCSDPNPAIEDRAATPNVDESKPDESQNELDWVLYHSIAVGYALPEWQSNIGLGVNNLFDKDPPVSYATSTIYTWEPTVYDIPGGRFTYVKFTKHF